MIISLRGAPGAGKSTVLAGVEREFGEARVMDGGWARHIPRKDWGIIVVDQYVRHENGRREMHESTAALYGKIVKQVTLGYDVVHECMVSRDSSAQELLVATQQGGARAHVIHMDVPLHVCLESVRRRGTTNPMTKHVDLWADTAERALEKFARAGVPVTRVNRVSALSVVLAVLRRQPIELPHQETREDETERLIMELEHWDMLRPRYEHSYAAADAWVRAHADLRRRLYRASGRL